MTSPEFSSSVTYRIQTVTVLLSEGWLNVGISKVLLPKKTNLTEDSFESRSHPVLRDFDVYSPSHLGVSF